MEEKNTSTFREVSVRLRKDFQYDDAEPLGEDGPGSVLNVLKRFLGKVDTDIYCLLEYDAKLRLIREITYTPRTFQKALRHPESLLRQIILDNPRGAIVVRLTGRDFPETVDWSGEAPGIVRGEIQAMQQLGTLFELAGIKLLDYINTLPTS